MRGDFKDEAMRYADVDKAAQKEAERRIRLDDIRATAHRLMSEIHVEWESMEEPSIGETARADLSQAATLMHLAVHRLDSAMHKIGRPHKRN